MGFIGLFHQRWKELRVAWIWTGTNKTVSVTPAQLLVRLFYSVLSFQQEALNPPPPVG